MTRVRDSHRKRCARPAPSAVIPHSADPGKHHHDQSKAVNGNLNLNGTRVDNVSHSNNVGKLMNQNSTDEILLEYDTSVPAIEAMSKDTLLVKHKPDPFDAKKRQSLRHLLQQQHEDRDASLVLNLRNIRKRLNWKESKVPQDLPFRKKPRLESTECDIYLAIWDNSNASTNKQPIVSKREFCELTKIRRNVDPVKGDFVELKLDEPLIVTHKELRVPTRNPGERMALAKEYFMEIKIIPRDDKLAWPPIPILGKSDGDRFNGVDVDLKEEIQPILLARYQHLPTAPDAETPLALFVYAEGTTFRTKYGLEVDAKWVKSDHPALVRKTTPAPELESWAIDDGGKPFGRFDPNKKPVSRTARKTAPPSKKPTVSIPKVTYSFTVPKGSRKNFNKCSVDGFKCYVCPGKPFANIDELRFHLDQTHKNKYILENEVNDPVSERLSAVTIRVEAPSNQRLRNRQEQEDEEEKDVSYVAPRVPFDIKTHYTGKAGPWSKALPTQASVETAKIVASETRAKDSQSALRRENAGSVPYRQVLPFRPQQYQRKKFPNRKLLTQHVSLENPYTSVSHRPVHCADDEEDARSETDDEIDDTWFVNRHLEELDMYTYQQDWSDARRKLAKKWDWHILHRERGITAKYLGDCLIRFIRMEKQWILRQNVQLDRNTTVLQSETESIAALTEMMAELKDMKVINSNVCADVMTMLFEDQNLLVPAEEQQEINGQVEDVTKRKANIRRYKQTVSGKTHSRNKTLPPANVCAECRSPIGHENQRVVRCSNLRCSTPNVWYHAKCVALPIPQVERNESFESTQAVAVRNFIEYRSAWKCKRCEEIQAKGIMAPSVANMTCINSQVEEETDQVMTDAPALDKEQSRTVPDDDGLDHDIRSDYSREDSVPVTARPPLPKQLAYQSDVQDVLGNKEVLSTTYMNDRKLLRGIVLHHYHDQGKCIRAIIDERPSRSRSKKPHTVLVTVFSENTTRHDGQTYFVHFPDNTRKRASERWWLLNRCVWTEIFARFRPYKIQHYDPLDACETSVCSCNEPTWPMRNPYIADTLRKCRYHYSRLDKEPGRGFFQNEQNDPGTVWYGDYFAELRQIAEERCHRTTHDYCDFHSVTAKEHKYQSFGTIDRTPWKSSGAIFGPT